MKKEIYYYFRDDRNRPIVTVCLIKDGELFRRGLSICSLVDNPNKKLGRKIAKGRANKLKEPGECLPIQSDNAWWSAMESEFMYRGIQVFDFKSFMVTKDELTPFEYKLVEKACAS